MYQENLQYNYNNSSISTTVALGVLSFLILIIIIIIMIIMCNVVAAATALLIVFQTVVTVCLLYNNFSVYSFDDILLTGSFFFFPSAIDETITNYLTLAVSLGVGGFVLISVAIMIIILAIVYYRK